MSGNKQEIRYVSTSYALLTMLTAVLTIVAVSFAIVSLVDWQSIAPASLDKYSDTQILVG